MKVLLIIPVYNESKIIKKLIAKINNFKEETTLSYQLDYVVINDGSIDNTGEILDKCDINHVDLINNLGIGGAVQTGYIYARDNDYDVAVQFDGDGQHDIESLDTILEPILENEYDFVIGSRFIEESEGNFRSTWMRRFGISVISLAILLVCHKRIYDVTSGFRAANKKVISYLAKRYPVSYPEPESTAFLLKKRVRIGEKTVKMYDREEGISSIRAWSTIVYMLEVVTSIFILGFMRRKD
ncbi:MAG: glycosyltransferase family 2 protein [Lactobacillales bacterium]|jgi:glycosyltransferase involved in cell wall biosynthesis|nr:glycosyltransferase family 2 protein [Lactobacillales bacterium]